MARVMFIDDGRYKWFVGLGVISCVIMLGAILLGFLGPSTHNSLIDYAYDCPDNSHEFTGACTGVQLSEPNTYYMFELPALSMLNGFWSLIVYPYNTEYQQTGVEETLVAEVSIYGRSQDSGLWERIQQNNAEEEIFLCDDGHEMCWGFVLIYEDTIKYPYYLVNVTFPSYYTANEASLQYLGDVAFEYQWNNTAYIEMELSLRMLYLMMTAVSILLFWIKMRKTELSDWTIEQLCAGILLVSLVALNNPLYPFEFIIHGSFFPVLDCFLQVIHQCILLSFWLFMFDYIRKGGKKENIIVKHEGIKGLVVFAYGGLCFILFTWFRIEDVVDPVFGNTQSIFGLGILFFCCALLFGCLLIAVTLFMVLGISVVQRNPFLRHRYIMLAVPTLVLMVSLVGALFFGTFGPVQRTAPSFVYFFTLYNLYVLVLVIGYWPVDSAFNKSGRNPSEVTPIFGNASYSDPATENETL